MTTHTAHDDATDDHAAVDNSMRFEKSELHDFAVADRSAGEHIGILLAVVFCISLFLMVGVTYWTSRHQSPGHDPHTIVDAEVREHQ